MDPYLEAIGLWESFHAMLVAACAGNLNRQSPESYWAQLQSRATLVNNIENRERWIEILHLPEMELVTAIEILMSLHKSGSARSDYLKKRAGLLARPVNLVEIDMLLAGERIPMADRLPPGDYYAIVARAERRPDAEVYGWRLQQPLPILPIPLRKPDPDAVLNLAEVFVLAYDRGAYDRVLRCDRPLPASFPISPEDRAWAEGIGR
jgi:hypothetical protein